MTKDFTHTEASEVFRALSRGFGAKCIISVVLVGDYQTEPGALSAFVRPNGSGSDVYFFRCADNYRDLLEKCREALAKHSDLHASTIIREMALKIIDITADLGDCTDAALRATFDAADIARYGERACAEATEIAGLAPFEIIPVAAANDRVAA